MFQQAFIGLSNLLQHGSKVSAEFKDGVLKVRLPKTEKAKAVEVKDA